MTYEILFSPAAVRYFKKIRDAGLSEAYETALVAMAANPYVGKPKRGDLAGVYGYYEADARQLVVILAGTRDNFYDELKRYIRHT